MQDQSSEYTVRRGTWRAGGGRTADVVRPWREDGVGDGRRFRRCGLGGRLEERMAVDGTTRAGMRSELRPEFRLKAS